MNSLRWGMLFCTVNLLACNSNAPKQDGLLGSVHALQTGSYDTRLQSRQQKLAQLKLQRESRQKQLSDLKSKAAIELRRMQLLEGEVHKEQARKSRHAANIKKLNVRRNEVRRELLLLEKSMSALDQQSLAEAKKSSQRAASIDQLTKERDLLRQQLQLLIEKGI